MNRNTMQTTGQAAAPVPVEFYEAQMRPAGETVWFRLGGRTLEGAREAVALARKSRGITRGLVGGSDAAPEYRIRYFVGTATDLEV